MRMRMRLLLLSRVEVTWRTLMSCLAQSLQLGPRYALVRVLGRDSDLCMVSVLSVCDDVLPKN